MSNEVKKSIYDTVVTKLTSEAFDSLMKEADKQIKSMPFQTKSYAEEGIKFIKANKGDLIGLGKEGFQRFLTLLGLGEQAQARDEYIRTQLGPAELIALMNKNAEAIAVAAEKKKAFAAKANNFLVGLSKFAYNLIVTILFT